MVSPNHWQRPVPLNAAADSLPLKHHVICCTQVPDEKRTEMISLATQMGALHRFDLTLDVTHLIVGYYDTAKYRYVAKGRPDVRVMTMGWIEALRDLWIHDQEIDVEVLEKEHLLPTLTSLKFSMTGCDDPTERLQIAEQVKANGGVYEGDLTKQITHLISFRTEGAKYKAAKSWGLKIVSIEWLRDSLERGMILDETLYDPALPLEKRGIGAWDRTKPTKTALGKRRRDNSTEGVKRKLRRTASTKLNSQNDGMWGDIVAGGGSSFAQVSRSGVWESTDDQRQLPEGIEARKKDTANSSSIRTEIGPDPPKINGILSGCRFFLDGFEPKKQEILANHLVPNGAEVSSSIEGLWDLNNSSIRLFRIIPSSILEGKHFTLPQPESKIETITEWWVERCLHHKKFFEPSGHVIGRPFPKFPVEEFRLMTISSAAFTGIDLLHVKKAVELIGAKYSEDMTPQSSMLLTKSVVGLRKDKAEHAREWEIPIVNATWLWDSIAAGEKLSIQKYRFRSPKRSGSEPVGKNPSKQSQQAERSKSDLTKSISKTDIESSKAVKLSRASKLDKTAFISDEPLPVKEENSSQIATNISNPSTNLLSTTEPLSDISHNSPSRTVSTAPAPSDHPAPRPMDDLSNDISNLLNKTKTTIQPAQPDPTEGRKRGVNRILGRAVSNVSAASTPFSRASSVDSTATNGNPVQYPSHSNDSGKAASAREIDLIEHLINHQNQRKGQDIDSQPHSTQLQYDDPESKEYKERVMARMVGERVDPRRKGLVKERAVTLGDLSEGGMKSRGRRAQKPTAGIR